MDIHHFIILEAYGELHPFHPHLCLCFLGPSYGMPSCRSSSLTLPSRPPLLVSSPLLVCGPSLSSPCVTALAWREFVASKPSHDFLVSCALLLVWETQSQVHFWLVDKWSRMQPCLKLCRFAQTLFKAGLARWKVSFPYGVAREPNYNILSERMMYYSRYATRKKCIVLWFSFCN
jgi:hypothetical protein